MGEAVDTLKIQHMDGVQIVGFTESKLIDAEIIQQVGDELLATVASVKEGDKIVLSFRDVHFMSSAMLGRLVMFYKKCQQADIPVKVCSVSPDIFEVFKITKLNKMFDVQKDEQQALKSFTKKGWFG